MPDLSVSSVLVIVAVVAVIVLYYRWWRSVSFPLRAAAARDRLLFRSRVPAAVRSRSSTRTPRSSARSSSATGSTSASCSSRDTSRSAPEGERRGALVVGRVGRGRDASAALAAGVSYASLVDDRVPRVPAVWRSSVGIGMVLSWGAAFVLMPPLLAWLDRSPAARPPRPRRSTARRRVRAASCRRRRSRRRRRGRCLPRARRGRSATFERDRSSSTTSRSSAAPTRGPRARATGGAGWTRSSAQYLMPTVILATTGRRRTRLRRAARAESPASRSRRWSRGTHARRRAPGDQPAKIADRGDHPRGHDPEDRASLVAPESAKDRSTPHRRPGLRAHHRCGPPRTASRWPCSRRTERSAARSSCIRARSRPLGGPAIEAFTRAPGDRRARQAPGARGRLTPAIGRHPRVDPARWRRWRARRRSSGSSSSSCSSSGGTDDAVRHRRAPCRRALARGGDRGASA